VPRALDKARGSDPWHSGTPVLRHRAPWKACGVRTLRCLKGEGVSELRGTLAPAVPCGQPPQSPIALKASATAQPAPPKAWSNEPQCALARGRSQIVPTTTSSKSSALRPEAVSYTPVAYTALEKRTVITATLSFDCGASFTESDYTAPSSPCSSSSAAASDWSDATEKFVQLFPNSAFPLLDAELQRLTPATPPVNPPAAAPATPVVQQQRQRQQQQQRRRRGGYNRSVGVALWQHIAKAERLLVEQPASLKAKDVENSHEQKRLSSSSWFFRRNGLYIDDNSVSTAAPAPRPQLTVAIPLFPHPAVESSKGKQADSVAPADLAVGMLVKRVSEPSQVGKVLKVEGSSSGSSSRRKQRVCVDFSLSNGRARTWLNADELEEEAARKPAQKCPHPPQSLKAKLWYKKQSRVQSGKKQQ
jgi:hypothetical protein